MPVLVHIGIGRASALGFRLSALGFGVQSVSAFVSGARCVGVNLGRSEPSG